MVSFHSSSILIPYNPTILITDTLINWVYNLGKMKRLLTILILIFTFQTPSQADDIRDFQIEGMSIGDSLLDYFSEQEILAYKPDWFKDNEYSIANDLKLETFQTYKLVQAAYKTKDKKYIFEGIEGYKFYKKMDNCLKEFDEVVDEISKLSLNAVKGKKKNI